VVPCGSSGLFRTRHLEERTMNAKRSWIWLLALLLVAGAGSAEAKKKRGGDLTED